MNMVARAARRVLWLLAMLGAPLPAMADGLAVLDPIERPAFSDDWVRHTTRTAHADDMVFVVARTGKAACAPIRVQGARATQWQMLPIETTVPSDDETAPGVFHEVLVPRSAHSCTASSYVLIEWRAGQGGPVGITQGTDKVVVDVRVVAGDPAARIPFLVGMNPANLVRGHCPDGHCPREGELLRRYADLLNAHGLQPIQTFVRFPPIRDGRLDLDAGHETGTSFRQTVMDPAIHGRIGFPRASRYPDPETYLKALQRTVVAEGLVGRAWVYAADEPRDIAALARTLTSDRIHSPDVAGMVTTNRDRRLAGLVDVYAPVFNHLVSARRPGFRAYAAGRGAPVGLWTYLSCAGSCGPNRAVRPDAPRVPGPATGLADLLIDRPAARLFDFFRTVSGRVDGLLYYEATESYRLVPMGIDIFRDTWSFGGNGDGLLVFPGRPGRFGLQAHVALPSLRLKLLRHALQNGRVRTQH